MHRGSLCSKHTWIRNYSFNGSDPERLLCGWTSLSRGPVEATGTSTRTRKATNSDFTASTTKSQHPSESSTPSNTKGCRRRDMLFCRRQGSRLCQVEEAGSLLKRSSRQSQIGTEWFRAVWKGE